MTRRSLFADVSAELSGHVAVALRQHRKDLARLGVQCPPGVEELERDAATRATRGQVGTPLDDLWEVRHVEPVTTHLLTYGDAATALRCSVRTVKRRIRAGDLRPVRVGGLVRLRVADVDAYVLDLAVRSTTGEGVGVPSRSVEGTETVGVGISLSRSLKTLGSEGP